MKMPIFSKKPARLALVALAFLMSKSWLLAQPFDVAITTTVNPPPFSRIDQILDNPSQITMAVVNSGAARDVYFRINLTGVSGNAVGIEATIDGNLSDVRIPLAVGPSFFTSADLSSYYGSLDAGDYFYSFAEPWQEAVLRDGYLVAGGYRICLQAFDADSDVAISAETGPNCAEFEVVVQAPPVIVSPDDDGTGTFVAGNDQDIVNVMWAHDFAGFSSVTYDIEFRAFADFEAAQQFDEEGRPQDRFDALPLLGRVEGVSGLTHSTVFDDLDFLEGRWYSVRVTARSATTLFYNEGRSQPIIFGYGGTLADECLVPNWLLDWRFPRSGDTLPYAIMPFIGHFSPLCDNMRGFRSQMAFMGPAGRSGDVVRNLNWPNGPYAFLENWVETDLGITPASNVLNGPEDAQFINLMSRNAATDAAYSLRRGNRYAVWAQVTPRYSTAAYGTETTESETVELSGLTVESGMKRSVPISPLNGATVAGPRVDLEFRTSNPAEKCLPDFAIWNIEDGTPTEYFLQVKERLVVQVSRNEAFSDIIFRQQKRIQCEANDPEAHLNVDDWAFEPPSSASVSGIMPREYAIDLFYENVYRELSVTTPDLADGTYFWRIGWLREPENFLNQGQIDAAADAAFYRFSPVRRFIIDADGVASGSGPGGAPAAGNPPAPPPSECERACTVNTTGFSTAPLTALAVGQRVRAGVFDVTITEVEASASGDGRFTGRGTAVVKVDPAAAISLNVNFQFSNARFNDARQLVAGEMRAVRDAFGSEMRWIDRNIDGINRSIPSFPTGAEASLAFSAITNVSRLLTAATGGPSNLPFGIDLSDGQDFRIVASLDDLVLRPDGARGRYLLGAKFPESLAPDVPALIFGADQVCFSQDGPRGESRYFLAENVQFGDPSGWEVVIKGAMPAGGGGGSAASAAAARGTYIEFDCDGFKSLQFQGAVRFSRDALVPETAAGVRTTGTERVEATITTRIDKDAKFILGLNFEQPFQFTAVPDFGMTVRTAYLDFSESQNPPAMTFPPTYDFGFLVAGAGTTAPDARRLNAWTGFYLAELSFRFPRDFSSRDRAAISVGIRDFMIDDSGVSGAIAVGPIFSEGTPGRVGDWAFTIDEFRLGLVQSVRGYASMNGKIGLPIFAEGDFLRYGATLSVSETGAFGFELVVRPDPTGVRIPAWEIADITLAPTTFVKVGIGAAPEFAFSLTGAINFTGTTSGGVGMNMPRIEVERLRFSTTDGQFRGRMTMGGQPIFAQASPQKNMSGMPINLEGISIEPVGGINVFNLRFDLRVELGEVLAVEANPGFRFNLGRTGGPDFQRFTVEEFLMPDRMCLETDISGMSLAGCIRHCRQGGTERFVGELRIGIPSLATIELYADFGNYKNPTRPEALFNTADNFNFFAFEGSVRLTSGITLFSGVALYGLGGGVYYNMRPEGAQIGIPDEPTASADGEPSGVTMPTVGCSGGRYRPDFGPKIGFSFSAYLGDNAGGQAYNFDITISAELALRSDGSVLGFNRVTFDGRLYLFSSIGGGSDEAPVRARVFIQYTKNDGFEGVDGLIEVMLRLGPVRGCDNSDPTAPNKLVGAAFHADNRGMWYFHMGRPAADGQTPCSATSGSDGSMASGRAEATGPAGLVAELGILNVTIATYFMVGHNIPPLPALPPAIQNLFAGGGKPETGAINSGEVGSRREAAPAFGDTGMASGQGFAHGLYLHVGINLNFIIFYAALDMWMGYDINFRRYETECAGGRRADGSLITSRIGADGWYAKGQAYVGIRGEMGVGVNFDFFQAKIPILQAQAVLALHAEFPNPEWFRARASMSYSILNGAITGRCDFEIEAGARCINPNYDPLEGFEFITDLKPEGTGVSVFSKAEAAFSMRMDFPFEVRDERTATRDNPLGNFKRFKPEFRGFRVEKVDGRARAAFDPHRLTNSGFAADATPREQLEGLTNYEIIAEVALFEEVAGAWQPYRKRDGSHWKQVERATFTTAERPDYLVADNVRNSWPIHNQRFFLAGESRRIVNDAFNSSRPHSKGWVRLQTAQTSVFRERTEPTERRPMTYQYEARILPMRGGAAIHRSPIELGAVNRLVQWEMPATLPPDQLFCVQIVRISTPIRTTSEILTAAVGSSASALGGVQTVNKNLALRNVLAGNFSSAQQTERKLTGTVADDGAKVLYHFYFKTSRFQTLSEKLAATNFVRSTVQPSGMAADVFFNGPEPFERFDYYGFFRSSGGETVREIDPLVQFDEQFVNIRTNVPRYFEFMTLLKYKTFRHDLTGRRSEIGFVGMSLPSAEALAIRCAAEPHNVPFHERSGEVVRARYRGWDEPLGPMSRLRIEDVVEPLTMAEIEAADAPPPPRTLSSSVAAAGGVSGSSYLLTGAGVSLAASTILPVSSSGPSGNIRLLNNLPQWWELLRSSSENHVLRIQNRVAQSISGPSLTYSQLERLFTVEGEGSVWPQMQGATRPITNMFRFTKPSEILTVRGSYHCPMPNYRSGNTSSFREYQYRPN